MTAMRTCNGPSPGQRCPSGALIEAGSRGTCEGCSRQRERMRGSRQARGYGAQHDAVRAAREDAYGQRCHLCGERMWPHQELEPDHTEDRTGYRGWTHAACNHRDGAQRGNVLRRLT